MQARHFLRGYEELEIIRFKIQSVGGMGHNHPPIAPKTVTKPFDNTGPNIRYIYGHVKIPRARKRLATDAAVKQAVTV
jgi:hypothetical protein